MNSPRDTTHLRHSRPRRSGRGATPEYKFEDVLQRYLRVGCGDKAVTTRACDAACAKPLLRLLGEFWLTHDGGAYRKILNGSVVRSYREHRKGEDVQPVSIMRELSVASAAVRYCIVEEDFDCPNPFAGRLISKVDRRSMEPAGVEITAEQERLLLLAAEQPMQDMIAFALETGMRGIEIRGLTWDRVDLQECSVRFGAGDQKSRRAGYRGLSERAIAILRRQPRQEGRGAVFIDAGAPIGKGRFRYLWEKASARAGVDIGFHSLRHTWARRALAAGKSMEDIQAQLGHEDIRTTQKVYALRSLAMALRAVRS